MADIVRVNGINGVGVACVAVARCVQFRRGS